MCNFCTPLSFMKLHLTWYWVSLLKIQSTEWAFEKEDNDQIGWYKMWSMQWIIISVHASPFLVSYPDYFRRARKVWSGTVTVYFPWFRSALSRHHCLRDTIYDSYRCRSEMFSALILYLRDTTYDCRSEMFSAMVTKFSLLLFLIVQGERLMQLYR